MGRFQWSIPFFSTLNRGGNNETVHFKICDILNQKCVTSLWRHHVFEKTRKSKNLVLAKIESQDLKNDFKKGFSDVYFQKSETSFWNGGIPFSLHPCSKEKKTNSTYHRLIITAKKMRSFFPNHPRKPVKTI